MAQASRPPLPIEAVPTVIDLDNIELRDSGRISASGLAADKLALRSGGAGEILVSALSARALEVQREHQHAHSPHGEHDAARQLRHFLH